MYRSTIFTIFFFLSISIFAQERADESKAIISDVEELAHKKYKGREAGTKQELAAAEFIAKRFKDIGLSPLGDKEKGSYTYLQKFNFPKSKDPHTGTESEELIEGHNVIAYIANEI